MLFLLFHHKIWRYLWGLDLKWCKHQMKKHVWEINLTKVVNICTNICNMRNGHRRNPRSTSGHYIHMFHKSINDRMSNIKMNWIYFKNTLTEDERVTNFDICNWSYIIRQWGIRDSGDFNGKVPLGDKLYVIAKIK